MAKDEKDPKGEESDVQRWTAKRRVALVTSILKGETSAQEAARKHGLTVAEIAQAFLDGGVAECKSAAIPERRQSGVARSTANTGLAKKTRVKSLPQPQRSAPVSSIGRSFVEQARRYDVSGAQEIIAARHERGRVCGVQALAGQGIRWRWRGGERFAWRGRLFLCRSG